MVSSFNGSVVGWVDKNDFIRTQLQQNAGAEGINLGLVRLDDKLADGGADIVLHGPATRAWSPRAAPENTWSATESVTRTASTRKRVIP